MAELAGPHVLVIGAATVDIKGRVASPWAPGAAVPGRVSLSLGGVARNVAENLARLGVPTVLLAAVGDDHFGRRIRAHTEAVGVNLGALIVSPEARTGAYLAVMDERGTPVVSVYSTDITGLITPGYLYAHRRLFAGAQGVVVDANLSPRALAAVMRLAGRHGVPVAADPTSVQLAPRLRPHLGALYMVTPNVAEAEVLAEMRIASRNQAIRAAQRLVGKGAGIALIAMGEEGVVYASRRESGSVPAIRVEVADYTGAGDALTAAVVYGLLHEFPLGEAVRLGVSAAALTLQCQETVCPDLTLERLYDQLVI